MSRDEPPHKKVTVLVDLHDLRVASTGIKTYIRELLKALEAIGSDKITVVTCPPIDQVDNKFFRENSKWKAVIFHLFTIYWKQVVIPFKIRRHKIDVLISPDFYAPIWKIRARKIVVFHDAFFWENRSHYNALWGRYFRSAVIWGLRGKSVVLTVSEASKSKLRGIVPEHVPIEVAHTSIDFSAVPQQKPVEPATPYFLHVGVFEKRKNLTMLIKAFRQFKNHLGADQPFQLVLIGNQYPRPTLSDWEAVKEIIEEEDLQGSVISPGHLTLDEVWAYYRGATGYVLPSVNEGFGLPLLEAFYAEIPVIISDIDVLQEIAGGAALMANPYEPQEWAQKMRRIYFEENLREELVSRGKARLKDFTLSNFAEELERVLFK